MKRKPWRNNKENSSRLSDEERADIYDDPEDIDEEDADEEFGYEEDFDEDCDEAFDEDEVAEDPDDEEEESEDEQDEVIVKPKKHILLKMALALCALCLLVILADVVILFFTGELWFNRPDRHTYPERGVVITEKAGVVDWKNFARQDIQFCYIRATKGEKYADKNFKKNLSGASKTELPVGLIHQFDPSVSGEKQAKHFISECGKLKGRLCPVVDCQLGLFRKIFRPNKEKMSKKLRELCDCISEEYGCMPIIKCSSGFYERVELEENFADCPVWIVSEFGSPDEGVEWDIWTYSPRARFNHYDKHNYLEIALLDKDFKLNKIK